MNHFKIEPQNNIFKSLVVDITHKCNMHCANCYIPNRSIPDMDKDKLLFVLKKLPFKTHIRLIGAEPTMREDLPDIIRQIKNLRHDSILFSNGLKLSDYSYVKNLKKAGLNKAYLSMNGADDDKVYKMIDNGCYAKKKSQALNNLFKLGIITHIGCIIARGVNEHIPSKLLKLVINTAKKNNTNFRGFYAIRFRSVGAIGRHMKNKVYSFIDLVDIISKNLLVNKNDFLKNPAVLGVTFPLPVRKAGLFNKAYSINRKENSYMTTLKTIQGRLHIKITNWDIDKEGVIDPGNKNRGRITKDFKIAPFYEDVKINEYGY